MKYKALIDFEEYIPKDIIFWSGSGISILKPTGLPDGQELTKLCMNSFMPIGTYQLLEDIFMKGNFKDSYGNKKISPRLELIIEDIVGVLGYRAFDYFSFMNIPEQFLNNYHRFFAFHIKESGTHFTTNFDNGIEAAMPICSINIARNLKEAINIKSKLIKLHGSIAEKALHEDLGLTLKNIVFGINESLAFNILNLLSESKLLLFLGYGGVDSFDVTTFYEYFIGIKTKIKLNNLKVLWIRHKENSSFEEISIKNTNNGGSNILTGLLRAGAKVQAIEGNTTEIISFLKDFWGWRLQETDDNCMYSWKIIFNNKLLEDPISEEEKKLIACQYMAALGIGYLAVEFCKSKKGLIQLNTEKIPKNGILTSPINQWWRVYTNGLRDCGKYSEAIKNIYKWQKYIKYHFDYFVTLSRLMGEYRIRGNFIKALLIYKTARKLLKRINIKSINNPDEITFLTEYWVTYLHLQKDLWENYKGIIFLFISFDKWIKLIYNAWIESILLTIKRPDPRFSAQLKYLAINVFNQLDYFLKQTGFEYPSLYNNILKCLETSEITNYKETDSLLGEINIQRDFLKNNLKQAKIDELKENIIKATATKDFPGIYKAYLLLAKKYLMNNENKNALQSVYLSFFYLKKVEYSIFFKIKNTLELLRILLKAEINCILR